MCLILVSFLFEKTRDVCVRERRVQLFRDIPTILLFRNLTDVETGSILRLRSHDLAALSYISLAL